MIQRERNRNPVRWRDRETQHLSLGPREKADTLTKEAGTHRQRPSYRDEGTGRDKEEEETVLWYDLDVR